MSTPRRIRIIGAYILLVLLAVNASAAFKPRDPAMKPVKSEIKPGFDGRRVEVKFRDDLDIGINQSGVPVDRTGDAISGSRATQLFGEIAQSGGSWSRMSVADEYQMDQLVSNAERNLQREIADINNYFILKIPEGVNTVEWLDRLNELDDVEIALACPLPAPLPILPPDYLSSQGYHNAAPAGVDAGAAWALPGGSSWGTYGPVRVYDFEYSWNLNHDDLPSAVQWVPPGKIPSDPFSDDNHGTAVLGVIHGLNNSWGAVGGLFAGHMNVCPTYLDGSWELGAALSNVIGFAAGAVFVIEQQFQGPNYTGVGQDGLIPVEWWASWYALIVTAVGNGHFVIEAAGNGQEDLDDPIYSTGNGGHWPFLPANNSGAMIVGAGAAPGAFGGSDTDRSRLWFSNWGSRVDLQGWGEIVVTTGYGDLYSAEGKDLWYTNTFSGTSSATPIVANAVALLEATYREANSGAHVSPNAMRSVLIATGSPQQAGTYPISQHIGPRPDIAAALTALAYVCGDSDGSGGVDIDDVVYLLAYIFSGGPAPSPLSAGDADCSGAIDIDDVVYLIAYIFSSGPAPCDPDGDTVPDC